MIRIIRRRSQTDANNTPADAPEDSISSAASEGASEPHTVPSNRTKSCPSDVATQKDSLGHAEPETAEPESQPARARWKRVAAYGLLPALAMLVAGATGYLKWLETKHRETQSARIESVQVAMESTVKILSYSPDTVGHDLDAARGRLTGTFRDAYTQLTHDVVIPGAKEKKITAVATVPAAASISASPHRAVVMVFVNQSTMMGNDPPSSTASTVRVTLDKQDNRWLISDFTPI